MARTVHPEDCVFPQMSHGGYTRHMQWLRRVGASAEMAPLRESVTTPDGRSWPLVGLLIWAAVCLLPLDGDGVAWWAGRFVLLAALVWIPLALSLVDGPGITGTAAVPRLARLLE